MLSVQSVGYLVTGAFVGIVPRYLGAKQTYLILSNLAFLGLVLMMVTGNPVLLLLAMLMTGISKGSTCNFGNQFVSCLTNSDAGALNLVQAFFAIGACVAPMIAMVCGASWRMAFGIVVVCGVLNFVYSLRMKVGPGGVSAGAVRQTGFRLFPQDELLAVCDDYFLLSGN